jgi:hypothetical protein
MSLDRFKCTSCNEAEAAYYCEECKSAFCLGCAQERREEFFICGSCGFKETNLEIDRDKKSFSRCPNCGSTDLRSGIRKWKLCPNCRSGMVISVQDKRVELKKTFIDNVNSILYGYELLKDFSRRLKETRKRLIFLRHRRYFHYPKMEETLISLFQEIISLKKKVEARAQQVLNVIQVQLVDFSYPDNWSPRDFAQIQTAVDRIKADVNDYKVYVKGLMELPERNLDTVVSLVKLLSFHWKLFEEHREKIDLEIGEKPVAAIQRVKYVGSSFLSLEKCSGILLLTDKRIIFIREKGILNKSYQKHFELPLKAHQIVVEGSIWKKLSFEGSQGDVRFSASKNTLKAIERYVELAKNFDKSSIKDKTQTDKLEKLEITLDDLKTELHKKIMSVFTPQIKEPSRGFELQPPVPTVTPRAAQKSSPPLSTYNRVQVQTVEGSKRGDVLDWERRKFSIEQLLKKIEELWRRGDISVEEYLKRMKNLYEELYVLNQKLKEIEVQA